MLTLHVLGHAYAEQGGRLLPLPRKALALLTYLVLEGQPVHREIVAELLWEGPTALPNLRAELSKLRACQIDLGPPRAPLLKVEAATDGQAWLTWPAQSQEWPLQDWLSVLRGIPLSGLEDSGTAEFSDWVSQQRQHYLDTIEAKLQATWLDLKEKHPDAAQLVVSKAAGLGLEWPGMQQARVSRSVPVGKKATTPLRLPVSRSATTAWTPDEQLCQEINRVIAQCRRAPQVLLLSGHVGSGRRELMAALTSAPWLHVEIDSARDSDHILTSIIMKILAQLPETDREPFRKLLQMDAQLRLEQLGLLLMDRGQPINIVVLSVEELDSSLFRWLAFAMDWPVEMLVTMLCTPLAVTGMSSMMFQFLAHDRIHLLGMPPLAASSLNSEAHSLGQKLQATAQGEGWLQAVMECLSQPAQPGERAPLSEKSWRTLVAEIFQEFELPHEQQQLLRLVPAPFPITLAEAEAVLPGCTELVREGIRRNLFEVVPDDIVVNMPAMRIAAPQTGQQVAFRSELYRQALLSLLTPDQRNFQPPFSRTQELKPPGPVLAINQIESVSEPPAMPNAARSAWARFPGGYLASLEGEQLSLLRRGAGRSPTLSLGWPIQHSGAWDVLIRFEAFLAGGEQDFALQVSSAAGSYELTSPQLGQWLRLSGNSADQFLRLHFRARELIVMLARVQVGTQKLVFGVPALV